MSAETAIRRFREALDRAPPGAWLEFGEVVRLAESSGVSLFEAAHVLDLLVARGEWQRELVDRHGRVLPPDAVVAGWVGGYRVAWHHAVAAHCLEA